MSEKFTPGEWTAHLGIMEPTFVFIGREEDYDDEKTPIICELHFGIKKKYLGSRCIDMDDSEKQANAHLIAAAPKMYQRLKSVKTDLWALSVNPAISAQTKECIDIIIKNIEGDLKKARGEE